ncbi:putative colanic acid biosynthesis acetyltransferase [Opitutus sp. ER46]|uniref:putative colanic acid biosynthesis acetyltransferase n=1 Tax=Opitutus sp. ER46 TaxID=2161864 RepID=UPI000D310E1A|nr:putative colanic acid biosynthesis acetyltransferase [Opitutus sp. ER46]PTX91091.1 putative colanic acid biosynthesis acetyltransferase [Opitutus sp. ER46]
MPIDIAQHLQNHNYSPSIQLRRVAWTVVGLLFRFTPWFCHGFRNTLLRGAGATIGRGVRIHPTVRITFPWNLKVADHVVIGAHTQLYALAPILIEHDVLISHGAHLCAGSHDYTQANLPIAHAPVRVESGTWIAVEAFIGPGVTIGTGSVVGARAVVMRTMPAKSLVAGNPARVIRPL